MKKSAERDPVDFALNDYQPIAVQLIADLLFQLHVFTLLTLSDQTFSPIA